MEIATVAQPSKQERVRLHITPLNAELLDRILPSSSRTLATNVSLHSVQSFPDRGFGYVELPAVEADKLRKKLNGATLKGMKVRVEDARPEKKRKVEVEEDEVERKDRKKVKKNKRKKEDGVLPGHELEEGRHVKRGWKEEGSGRRDVKKSNKQRKEDGARTDTLEGKKMQFKTSVPANASAMEHQPKKKTKDKEGEKKAKSGKKKVVIQEGKRSSKLPSVSERSGGKTAVGYEDGKGWVDGDGEVLEPEPETRKRKRRQQMSPIEDVAPAVQQNTADNPVDSAGPSTQTQPPVDDDDMSGSGAITDGTADKAADTDMDVDEGVDAESGGEPGLAATRNGANNAHPGSEVSEDAKVHPLEALYKRPVPPPESESKPKPHRINTSFNFFNADDADEADDEVAALPPQTPHTKQDLESRSLRSAAPTPDTAAIGRKFSLPFTQRIGSDDEDEDEDEASEVNDQGLGPATAGDTVMEATQPATAGGEKEESEYRKWFYDNRGDLNRGWKKRRREERKQKRQRENRRVSRRVV